MCVSNQMGKSPTRIAKETERSHHTVIKYISNINFKDPEIQALISRIKEAELNELEKIGGLARSILIDYLFQVFEGKKEPNPISVTAILDRTFTQKRLLLGQSTENIDLGAKINQIKEALDSCGRAIEEDLKLLESPVRDNQGGEVSNESGSPVENQGKGSR